jgi:hypothetical protein
MKLIYSSRALSGFAIALAAQVLFTACTEQEIYALLQGESAIANEPAPAPFAPGAGQYGLKGTMSAQKLNTLKSLAWPQSYEDMKGSFGFPLHRTETADYYALENDASVWVVIHYSGKSATHYALETR